MLQGGLANLKAKFQVTVTAWKMDEQGRKILTVRKEQRYQEELKSLRKKEAR